MSDFYLEYPVSGPNFSAWDLEIINHLKQAAVLVGKIYSLQTSGSTVGLNYYPEDATKAEILDSAKSDPLILNPYTVVRRNSSGKLYAVPYHEEYKSYIDEICVHLRDSAKLAANLSLKNYLLACAECLTKGEYQQGYRHWVSTDSLCNLDFLIGPTGLYTDNLMWVKRAFNCSLSCTTENPELNASNFVDPIRSVFSPSETKSLYVLAHDKLKVRVDDIICVSGRNYTLPARAMTFPSELNYIKTTGVKMIVFVNNVSRRDGELLVPILHSLLDTSTIYGFKDKEILKNCVYMAIIHEVTKSVYHYENSHMRLGHFWKNVHEFHNAIVGIKAMGYQVIKGILSQKDFEYILYVLLMRTFSEYFIKKKFEAMEYYLSGYRVFYNYCLEFGAIRLVNDCILPNAGKMYECVDRLSRIAMHLMSSATEQEAREFFGKYSSEFMYSHFANKLRDYSFKIYS